MSDNPSLVLHATEDIRYEQRPIPERESLNPPSLPAYALKLHSSRPRRRCSPSEEDGSVPSFFPTLDLHLLIRYLRI
jgi:hypothetical protein